MTAAPAPVALMDYLRLATDYLREAGSPSPRLDAEVLLVHVLGMDRMSLYVNFDRPLEPAEVDDYREALRRRGRWEPVAYITGRKEFRGLVLETTRAALIPRPETELLVEAVLERLAAEDAAADRDGTPPLRVVDVGTGTGAVAVALAAALDDVQVAAVDISEEALALARRNAEAHHVAGNIRFILGDLLGPLLEEGGADFLEHGLDAVVSNPPYVATSEWGRLPADVKKYEPRLALDGGADGLDFYRRLAPQAWQILKRGALLALEIGADQGAAVVEILHASGRWAAVEVLADYGGRDRIVVATKES